MLMCKFSFAAWKNIEKKVKLRTKERQREKEGTRDFVKPYNKCFKRL